MTPKKSESFFLSTYLAALYVPAPPDSLQLAICMGVPVDLNSYFLFPIWNWIYSPLFLNRFKYVQIITISKIKTYNISRDLLDIDHLIRIRHDLSDIWMTREKTEEKKRKKRNCMWVNLYESIYIWVNLYVSKSNFIFLRFTYLRLTVCFRSPLPSFSRYILFSSMICNLHCTSISTPLKQRTAREKAKDGKPPRKQHSHTIQQKR